MKTSPLFLLLVLSLAACFSGCGTLPALRISEMPGERRITTDDRVMVELATADRTRVDNHHVLGFGDQPVLTGPVWADVFIGDSSSVAKLSVASGRIEMHTEALGFVAPSELLRRLCSVLPRARIPDTRNRVARLRDGLSFGDAASG